MHVFARHNRRSRDFGFGAIVVDVEPWAKMYGKRRYDWMTENPVIDGIKIPDWFFKADTSSPGFDYRKYPGVLIYVDENGPVGSDPHGYDVVVLQNIIRPYAEGKKEE
jgi:hypothetical protein